MIDAPRFALALVLVSFVFGWENAQTVTTNDPPFYGPFNAVFLPDGDGLEKKLGEHDSLLLNYISLLPGEVKEITVQYHSYQGLGVPQLALRGWNVPTKIVFGSGKK